MNGKAFMQLAIDQAARGITQGQAPFGAVVVLDGQLISAAHNTVWQDNDPTAHAEVNAIRQAALGLQNISLSGCTMFTTCEPCPMCLTAIHWSRIDRVVYGATIADAAQAGFSELEVEARVLASLGRSPLIVDTGPLRNECRKLFQRWKADSRSRPY